MRLRGTPVPIPNTTVKTQAAEGTALETVWENRWLPEQKKKGRQQQAGQQSELPPEARGKRPVSGGCSTAGPERADAP